MYDDTIVCGTNPAYSRDPTDPIADCKARNLSTTPQGPRACDDPGLLSKRFFGSIALTTQFYNWATGPGNQGRGLQDLLYTREPSPGRKDNAHMVRCADLTHFG